MVMLLFMDYVTIKIKLFDAVMLHFNAMVWMFANSSTKTFLLVVNIMSQMKKKCVAFGIMKKLQMHRRLAQLMQLLPGKHQFLMPWPRLKTLFHL